MWNHDKCVHVLICQGENMLDYVLKLPTWTANVEPKWGENTQTEIPPYLKKAPVSVSDSQKTYNP